MYVRWIDSPEPELYGYCFCPTRVEISEIGASFTVTMLVYMMSRELWKSIFVLQATVRINVARLC